MCRKLVAQKLPPIQKVESSTVQNTIRNSLVKKLFLQLIFDYSPVKQLIFSHPKDTLRQFIKLTALWVGISAHYKLALALETFSLQSCYIKKGYFLK